jgi:hypothetical protein
LVGINEGIFVIDACVGTRIGLKVGRYSGGGDGVVDAGRRVDPELLPLMALLLLPFVRDGFSDIGARDGDELPSLIVLLLSPLFVTLPFSIPHPIFVSFPLFGLHPTPSRRRVEASARLRLIRLELEPFIEEGFASTYNKQVWKSILNNITAALIFIYKLECTKCKRR